MYVRLEPELLPVDTVLNTLAVSPRKLFGLIQPVWNVGILSLWCGFVSSFVHSSVELSIIASFTWACMCMCLVHGCTEQWELKTQDLV